MAGGFKRKLKNINLGSIGLLICLIGLFVTLADFANELFFNSQQGFNFTNFIYLIINVFFYIIVGRSFLIARNSGEFMYARYGIVILIISQYVMPTVRTLLQVLIFQGVLAIVDYVSIGLFLGSAAFGIAYFIFMILEFRQSGKNFYIPMFIFGIILLIINIFLGAVNVYAGIKVLMTPEIGPYQIINAILSFFEGLGSIAMGVLFFLYPLYGILRRNGKM